MTNDRRDIWFPAKRYGWGWGLPVAWQGWVVLLVYVVLLLVGANEFRLARAPSMLAYLALITAALIAICCAKGDKLRWRWGDPNDGS